MRRIINQVNLILAVALLVLAPRSNANQVQQPGSAPNPISEPDINSDTALQIQPAVLPATIADRLTTLTPNRPAEYFELAEDSFDQRQFDLATRLFVLAAQLDSARFGRSACLGIVAIAQAQHNPQRARQMRAMARMFPSDAGHSPNGNINTTNNASSLTLDENASPEAEFRRAGALVSAFLGFYRTGFGNRALKTLNLDQQTYALLTEYETAIGSISQIFEYCRENTRCHLCQNTLYVELPDAHQIRQDHQNNTDRNRRPLDPRAQFEVCPDLHTYLPQISTAEMKNLLNIETALAGGTKARWGAQLALAKNKTRPILDPAFLPRMLNINPNQTIYQDGRWKNPSSSTNP